MKHLGKRALAIFLTVGICVGMIGSDIGSMSVYAMGQTDAAAAESTVPEDETVESTVYEPSEEEKTEETTAEEPSTVEPTTPEPSVPEPTTVEPSSEEPVTELPTTEEPTTQETVTEELTTEAAEPLNTAKDITAKSGTDCVLGVDEDGVLIVESGNAATLSGSVEIPAGTKVIPDGIFKNNLNVTGISFKSPVVLETIEAYAFQYSGIVEMHIPATVTKIGDYAFSSSDELGMVSLDAGGSLVELGNYVFASCGSMDQFVTNKRLKTVGRGAFQSCSKLSNRKSGSKVDLDLTNVTSIDQGAFAGCSALQFIVIPDSVTEINENVFKNCTSLGKDPSFMDEDAVTISNSVTVIKTNAFAGCTSLSTILLPASVKEVKGDAFVNCNSLKSVKSENKTENEEGENIGCVMTLYYTSFPFNKDLILYSYAGDLEEWAGDHISFGITYKSLYKTNDIKIEAAEHGKITANATSQEESKKVLLTITPDKNYVLDSNASYIETSTEKKYFTEIVDKSDSSFVMPASAVTIYPVFVASKDVYYGITLRLDRSAPLGAANGESTYDDEAVKYTPGPPSQLNFTKPGKRVGLNIEGSERTAPTLNYSQLKIESSDTSVVAVNSYGTVRSKKEGTATITISLIDNPKNVKPLEIKVSVGAKTFVKNLSFKYEADSRIKIEKAETAGTEAHAMGYDLITVRSSIVNTAEKKIVIYPIGVDETGDTIIVPYTWSSLDKNIAVLTQSETSLNSNTLTLVKGAVGETIITVKSKQVAKGENATEVERKFIVRIVDDTPRLAEKSLTVDPLSDTGTELDIVSNYGYTSELSGLKIVEKIKNDYSDKNLSSIFEVVTSEGKVYLRANPLAGYQVGKTYEYKNCYLEGKLEGSEKPYHIPITSIKICKKNIKPAFTLSGKLNLFYNGKAKEEEIGKVTVTSRNKDLEIEKCTLVGNNPVTDTGKDDGKFANNFTISEKPQDGKLYLTRTTNDMATYSGGTNDGKPVLSGYIKINYKGYDSDYYYKITVPNYTTAPTYTVTQSAPTTAGKITLNSLASDQERKIQFINRKTKKVENLTDTTQITFDRSDSGTNVNVNNGAKKVEGDNINQSTNEVTLQFTGRNSKSGCVVLNLLQDTWEDQSWNAKSSVNAKIVVTVTGSAPTAKLGKSTLNLNQACADIADSTTMKLNQEDASLEENQEITATGRNVSENLDVKYKNGKIYAAIKEGMTVPKGTYKYTCTPRYNLGQTTKYGAKAITFSVKVTDTAPSITLKSKTFSINGNCYSADGKHDKRTTTFTWKNLPAEYSSYNFKTDSMQLTYTGRNVDPLEITKDQCTLDIAQKTITVELARASYGTSSYKVEGLQLTDGDTEIAVMPFTITVSGKNTNPLVSVSAKGTINPLDPESKIEYTAKLSNVSGKVDGVKLVELSYPGNEPLEEEERHFTVDFNTATGVTTVKVKSGEVLENRKYRIQLFYTLENSEDTYQVTKDQYITPKQILPKVKTDVTSVKLFAGNKERLAQVKLTKTSTKTADIDKIIISEKNKSYDFLKDAFEEPTYDPATGIITLKLKNSALVKQNVAQDVILETHCNGQLTKTTGTTFKVKITVIK